MKKLLTHKAAEFLLIGFIRLFGSASWVYKFVPSNTDYKPGSIRKAQRNGIIYQLDLSDYQEWLVYFYCKADSSLDVISYLDQSEVIIDIGANIGQTSLNIFRAQEAKKLKPQIHAFEPFPATFEKLRKNIQLNNLEPGIFIYQAGIGAEQGELQMIRHCETNSGGFRITNEINEQADYVRVPVITLDSFVAEHGITRIDFIKMDIEGFEYEALKGMKNTLEQLRPTLFLEFSALNMKELNIQPEALVNFLIDLNYTVQDMNGLVNFSSLESYTGHTDLLCLPKNN